MPSLPVKMTIAQGDTLVLPSVVLTDSVGSRVNLAGSTATFRMVNAQTGTVQVNNQSAQITQNDADPASWGQVRYLWQTGDTDVAGIYQCWFTITTGGLTKRFPADGTFYLLINPVP